MKTTSFTLLLLFCMLLPAKTQDIRRSWLNVNYAGDSSVAHQMDIYLPPQGEGPFPVIIAIYGSAWQRHDQKQAAYRQLGPSILANNFAVVAINHRSSDQAIFPAQVHDVKAAVRYVSVRGAEYRLDPSFIGVTGYSSGGHLAAMLGTTGNTSLITLDGVTLDMEGNTGDYTTVTKSQVDAVVDWFGPTNFLIMDSCGSDMVHDAPDSPESLLTGGPIQENTTMVALANPVTYVDETDPPFLIIHGDADPLVPYCQSIELYETLQAKGVASEFILVPGGEHGPGVMDDPRFLRAMMLFFVREMNEKRVRELGR